MEPKVILKELKHKSNVEDILKESFRNEKGEPMTIADIADFLGVPPDHVYKWKSTQEKMHDNSSSRVRLIKDEITEEAANLIKKSLDTLDGVVDLVRVKR